MALEGLPERTISTDLVYELTTCILEKKMFRDKIPYTLISTTIDTLLEQSIKFITAETLLECFSSIPLIDPHSIINQKSISKDLTTKKKEELANIVRWLLPAIRQTSSKKHNIASSVLIISLNPGQGKTSMTEALYKTIKHISTDKLKQRNKDIIKTSLNSEIEAQNLDMTSYSPGAILIADGFTKSQNVLAMENVTYVIFTDKKHAQKIKGNFPQNMVYNLEIDDMDSSQCMELIEKRFNIEDSTRSKVLKTVQKLLEVSLSPKKILSILDYSSQLDNEAMGTKGFSFNQNTIEMVASHAGVTFGYDFNLQTLHDQLKNSVFGQDHAIDLSVEAVGIAKYGMRRKNKPLLVAMFGGPTGIGKTELASSLSKYLFGENTLLRIDMGEYTEHHSVARLIGAPPGYVGYSTDTAFAAALKKTARRVILFDEVEKAAPDVHQLLLGIMDSGRLTLSTGEVLDLKESVIILTTNSLADKAGKVNLGFIEPGTNRDSLANYREELLKSKIFSYEFINRIDAIIPFNTLTEAAANRIALREINIIREELQYQGYHFTYTDEALAELIKKSDKTQGGRGILRGIDSWKRQIVSKIRNGDIVLVQNRRTVEIKKTETF